MKKLENGLNSVPGYKFSSLKCGIRYNDRLDYTMIYSEKDCNAAGMFTKNLITAAPVKLCRQRINMAIRAILINSTNANACTGDQGLADAVDLTSDISSKLKTDQTSVLMASTGIIGHNLPVEKMKNRHSDLIKNLREGTGDQLARAIMTTDTVPKETAYSFRTDMGDFTIAGTAKGSGMIAPNMATLLSFILTDAPVKKTDLDRIFRDAINKSFNALTIDGDTSTNDTAVILSPAADEYLSKTGLDEFEKALNQVLSDLSLMLVHDGEGATKCVKIIIKNAADEEDAKKLSKTIGESLLVKTAFFGKDPNWGRIAMAAGNAGAKLVEEKLNIAFNDITLLSNGRPVNYDKNKMKEILELHDFSVIVDLQIGEGNAELLTSDISYDYVRINAEYST